MASKTLKDVLEFANFQLAAEAFLLRANESDIRTLDRDVLIARLELGNNHASKFVSGQGASFLATYDILAQYRNDANLAGGSGFSGTLFKNRQTGELSLSFRSTEFIDDAVRDGKSTR